VFPQQWFSIGGDSDRPDTSQLNLQPLAAVFLMSFGMTGVTWTKGVLFE